MMLTGMGIDDPSTLSQAPHQEMDVSRLCNYHVELHIRREVRRIQLRAGLCVQDILFSFVDAIVLPLTLLSVCKAPVTSTSM